MKQMLHRGDRKANSKRLRCRTLALTFTLGLAAAFADAAAPDDGIVLAPPVAIDSALNLDLSAQASLALIDLNGDGLPDLMTPGGVGDGPLLFLNNGTAASFQNVIPSPLDPAATDSVSYGTAVVGDINADGHPDVIAGYNQDLSSSPYYRQGLMIFLNNKTAGPFAGVKGILLQTTIDQYSQVALADVNGDGFPDVVAVGSTTTVLLTQGAPLSSGLYTTATVGSAGLVADGVTVNLADVNGDGKPDLIIGVNDGANASGSGVRVYLNNGTSNPFGNVTPLSLVQGQAVAAVAAADLNGDGKTDLIVSATDISSTQRFLSVFLNTGSATHPFTASQALPADVNLGLWCRTIVAADLNGDGRPDLAFGCGATTAKPNSTGVIYLNNATTIPFAGAAPIDIPPPPPSAGSVPPVALALAAGIPAENGPVELLVSDSAGSGPVAWSYAVQATPLPVAENSTANCGVGAACTLAVLANDRAEPGKSLNPASITITEAPLHGTATVSNGVIVYTPAAGFTGSDSFQYTVSDSSGSVSAAATENITVQAAPVAVSDAATLAGGPSLFIDVLSNDTVAGSSTIDPGTLKIVAPPAHGSAVVANGEVFYTANSGFSGTDSFRYVVADSLKSVSNAATATVSVTVPATTATPVALGASDNVYAIASTGHAPQHGGLASGYAYAAASLGSSLSWSGVTFAFAAADAADGLSNQAVNVGGCVTEFGVRCPPSEGQPPQRFAALKLLATGVNGAQQNQRFCMQYLDGYSNTPLSECVTLSLSDWKTPEHFAGESVAATLADRVTPGGALQAGPWYLYGYTIPLDPSRILLGVTAPANRDVVVLAMSLEPVATPTAAPVFAVDLANSYATSEGTANPGLGGSGYDFAFPLLGYDVVSANIPYQLISPQEFSGQTGVSGKTVTLPQGNYSQLYLLGTGYDGNQVNQPLLITYADGTTTALTQSFSDWGSPQHYSGESVAATTAYRYTPALTQQAGPWYAYSYSLPLDKTRRVIDVTLPNSHVMILGLTLMP